MEGSGFFGIFSHDKTIFVIVFGAYPNIDKLRYSLPLTNHFYKYGMVAIINVFLFLYVYLLLCGSESGSGKRS